MTQAAVAGQVHQTLDVHRHFAAQVAFDRVIAVDGFTDLQHFGVSQLVDAAAVFDTDLLDDLFSVLGADAVDILERDDHALIGRYVDASDTGHEVISCNASPCLRNAFLETKDDTYAPPTLPIPARARAHTRVFAEACPYRRVFASVNGQMGKNASGICSA